MAKEKIQCIYKIKSPSGKIYIGQTLNYYLREVAYRKGHCYKQRRLFNSFIKYGYENHIIEIIEYPNLELLNEREKFWILFYDCVESGLNLTYGGDSPIRSQETNLLISESKKGSKNPMWGKKKEKHHNYGKKASSETIKKLIASHLNKCTGKDNSYFKGYVTAIKEDIVIGKYEGVHDAAKKLGLHHPNISKVLLGKRKHTGGYLFKREAA
jgi:group I intron endonuclease